MNTIEIVMALILGLIVMVILIAIFTGKIAVSEKAQSCVALGGDCQARATTCPEGKPVTTFTNDCKGETQKCCIAVGG